MEWRQVTLEWAELTCLYFNVAHFVMCFFFFFFKCKDSHLSIREWDFPHMLQECFCSNAFVNKCYIFILTDLLI